MYSFRSKIGRADTQRKYDHSLKYDHNDKYDKNGAEPVPANNGGGYRNVNREGYNNSTEGNQVPQAAIAALDKRLSSVQHDLGQALQDVTSKENEKFDLIFSILVELQKRQAQLEESVRTVKAQLSSASVSGLEPQQSQLGSPQQQCQQQQAQQTGQQQGSQQQGPQVAGQMPMGSYMGGQMHQQYVAASDGSPTYFAPVVVAMPQGGSQMPYAVPQMMPTSPMQQMAMQFVGQGQAGEEYQWGGGTSATEGTARSSGSQNGESSPQKAQTPSGENSKPGPWVEEE